MNDYDDPDDDWDWDWDDEPALFVKEEPDCFSCNDAGCSTCRPSRVRLLAWRIQGLLRPHRRPFDDEAPF